MGQTNIKMQRPAVTWVYVKAYSSLYEVGFFDPTGEWQKESTYNVKEEAATRCHYLNGMGKETINRADCECCIYRQNGCQE